MNNSGRTGVAVNVFPLLTYRLAILTAAPDDGCKNNQLAQLAPGLTPSKEMYTALAHENSNLAFCIDNPYDAGAGKEGSVGLHSKHPREGCRMILVSSQMQQTR